MSRRLDPETDLLPIPDADVLDSLLRLPGVVLSHYGHGAWLLLLPPDAAIPPATRRIHVIADSVARDWLQRHGLELPVGRGNARFTHPHWPDPRRVLTPAEAGRFEALVLLAREAAERIQSGELTEAVHPLRAALEATTEAPWRDVVLLQGFAEVVLYCLESIERGDREGTRPTLDLPAILERARREFRGPPLAS